MITDRGLLPPAVERWLTPAALVLANLVPIAGVLLWGWDVEGIVIFYWAENLVLGAYTIIKMLTKGGVKALFLIAFFLIHYGGFCAGHGIFIVSILGDDMPSIPQGEPWPFFLIFVQMLVEIIQYVASIAPPFWQWALIALFVSHGVSFVFNYWLGGEHRDQNTNDLMISPYKRIFILHVAVIVGGAGVHALGSPLPLLVVLVLLKIGVDLHLHLREHRSTLTEEVAT